MIGRGPETPRQFYGGDLDGITERLDHLDRLGVNTVYLTPIFPARSNHRYDAASFDTVDPLLGGDAALARLADAVTRPGLAAARRHHHQPHRRRARVVRRAACRRRSARAGDVLLRRATATTSPGGGSSRCRSSTGAAPSCAGASPTADDSLLRRWLRPPYGLDGWRVDVANMTGRRGADATPTRWPALLRQAVAAARPDALLVAEHAHDATGDLDRDGWHGTMNYVGFTRPGLDLAAARRPARTELPGRAGRGAAPGRDAVLATMRAFRLAGLLAVADPLVEPARLARLRPDPHRGRRPGPAGGRRRACSPPCRAHR